MNILGSYGLLHTGDRSNVTLSNLIYTFPLEQLLEDRVADDPPAVFESFHFKPFNTSSLSPVIYEVIPTVMAVTQGCLGKLEVCNAPLNMNSRQTGYLTFLQPKASYHLS